MPQRRITPTPTTTTCLHPPSRYYTWWTTDIRTGKKDWLVITCCACGEVLKGSAEEYEAQLTETTAT